MGLRHYLVKLTWWGCGFQINWSVLQRSNLRGACGLEKVRRVSPSSRGLRPGPRRLPRCRLRPRTASSALSHGGRDNAAHVGLCLPPKHRAGSGRAAP